MILLTGHSGELFRDISSTTLPLMERYAHRYSIECRCIDLSGEAPPSWMKVRAIAASLQQHDEVLWIDADVVIVRGDENIRAGVCDSVWQALVPHDTPDSGIVPNAGVWIVRRPMLPTLDRMWDARSTWLDHPWWEQAALLTLMGISIDSRDGIPFTRWGEPTIERLRTGWLDAKWNDHPLDRRREQRPNFVHVTGYVDRLTMIRQLALEAT